MMTIATLMPSSRDHGTRPLFMEKAATSQYSQNAAHTTAKTSSTACIATQTATARGGCTIQAGHEAPLSRIARLRLMRGHGYADGAATTAVP